MATLFMDAVDKISPAIDKVITRVKRLDKEFSGVRKQFSNIKVPTFATALNAAGNAATRIFSSISKLALSAATSFTTINSNIEQMAIMMETATGTFEGGQKALNDMLDMSTKAPFSIDALSDSFVKLRTAGLDPMDGTLQTMVDSVAAFGGTSDQLRLVSIAVQQMVGKGVISMEELRRQFGEQVPTAIRAMASELNMNILDMLDLIGKGGLLSSKGIPALIAGLEKLHSGAAKERMDSFAGALALVRNQWTRLMIAIGEGEGSFDGMTGAVKAVADALERLRTSAAGAEIINKMSNSIKEFFKNVSENPEIIDGFFQNIASGADLAMESLKILHAGLVNTLRVIDAVKFDVNWIDLGKFDIKRLDVDTSSYGRVRGELVQITQLLDKLDISRKEFDSAVTMTMEELSEKYGQETANDILALATAFNAVREDIGQEIMVGKPNTVQFQAAMNELSKNYEDTLLQDIEALDHALGNHQKYMVTSTKSTQEQMKELTISTAESILNEMSGTYESLMKLEDKYKEKFKETRKELVDTQREFDNEIRELTREGLSDEGAWKDQLAQIEEYKKKAQQAFDSGDIEGYNTILKETLGLVRNLSTDGITKTFTKQDVENARRTFEYVNRITRSGKTAGTRDQYQQALNAYLQAQKAYKDGEKEVMSSTEQRAIKLKELKDIHARILETKKADVDKVQEELDKIEDLKLKYKSLEEAIKDLKGEFTYLDGAFDKTKQEWITGTEIMANKIDGLIDKIRELQRELSNNEFDIDIKGGGEARAKGGPVSAGSTYLVGEEGPELFSPNTSGYITPNNKLGGEMMVIDFKIGGESNPVTATRESAMEFFERSQRIMRRYS